MKRRLWFATRTEIILTRTEINVNANGDNFDANGDIFGEVACYFGEVRAWVNLVRGRGDKIRGRLSFPRGNDFKSARNRFRFRAELEREIDVFPQEIGLSFSQFGVILCEMRHCPNKSDFSPIVGINNSRAPIRSATIYVTIIKNTL